MTRLTDLAMTITPATMMRKAPGITTVRRGFTGSLLAAALLAGASSGVATATTDPVAYYGTSTVDGDGLFDDDEILIVGTNPSFWDTDRDGLSDGEEFYSYVWNQHLDPLLWDTDDDGYGDGEEVWAGSDPGDPWSVPYSYIVDSDWDGLTDSDEYVFGTDPYVADTDWDGLLDGEEVYTYYTDPTDRNTDNDRLSDGTEIYVYGTDQNLRDTDGGGLIDGDEVKFGGTDPPNPWDDGPIG